MNLTRIGVFIDGGYLITVSNYYAYCHERKMRIALHGILEFARTLVAREQNVQLIHSQIAAAHYYRGRLAAPVALQRDALEKERYFEDILSKLGIVPHYLPLIGDVEKGIDVWFALDVYELAMRKSFDIAVLVTADGDFVPLIQKLNNIGMPSIVLAWELPEHEDFQGGKQACSISRSLCERATYFVPMHQVIEDSQCEYAQLVDVESLFVPRSHVGFSEDRKVRPPSETPGTANNSLRQGAIFSLHNSYGFIVPKDGSENLFFHSSEPDFENLRIGDSVEYLIGSNTQGPCARQVRRVV